MTIGVLAFQGDFQRHYELLLTMGTHVRYVRRADEVSAVDGLIIPGGESTTIGKLLVRFGIMEPLQARVRDGMPLFGTCAGAILLAKEIEGSDQDRIGAMDISVARNAYGRQIESFEADIVLPALSGAGMARGGLSAAAASAEPIRGVFIRAPIITSVGPEVEVLATFEGRPVVVRQGNLLAATFHPELAGDGRIHELFLSSIERAVAR